MPELKTGTPLKLIEWLAQQPQDKQYKITPYHPKRSLAANDYAWALITQIAEAMNPPQNKNQIYLKMLKDYGQSEFVSVRSDIDIRGYFKYYEECGKGHVEGREFTHYKIYKGSSEMDAREMNVLLEGIIQEAKDLGIETMTPQEKARLISQMEGRDGKENQEQQDKR